MQAGIVAKRFDTIFIAKRWQLASARHYFSSKSSDSSSSPVRFNPGFVVVPQQSVYVVERLGKFNKVLAAGFHLLIPIFDRVAYVHSLKEMAIDVPNQSAITKDNVTLNLDGVLYIKIDDPHDASYGVDDPMFAVTQLAQTTMRSEIGKLSLDETFLERDNLNSAINNAINGAARNWGIKCMRYEIKDITLPQNIRQSMEKQAEAERRKRAEILQSEGDKQSEINHAEGRKAAIVLEAEGEAEAIRTRARATAEGLRTVSSAFRDGECHNAVTLQLAEKYVQAFSELAKSSTSMILPAQPNDPTNIISHAVGMFAAINRTIGNHFETNATTPSRPQLPSGDT